MSECIAAQIEIGGQIPDSLVPALCQAIAGEQASPDWGDAPLRPQTATDLLDACNEAGVLWLCDDDANWGEFAELEKFLEQRGIPFNRQREAKYEYDAERVVFRPGRGKPLAWTTDVSGKYVVRCDQLTPVLDALYSAQQQPTLEAVVAVVRLAQQLLVAELPPEMPPLPPLQIVARSQVRGQR